MQKTVRAASPWHCFFDMRVASHPTTPSPNQIAEYLSTTQLPPSTFPAQRRTPLLTPIAMNLSFAPPNQPSVSSAPLLVPSVASAV
jgi:hypothetical protein